MGDGRVQGSSATGDGGQAAISFTPDVDGMHIRIFESLQLEGSYVGDLTVFLPCTLLALGCKLSVDALPYSYYRGAPSTKLGSHWVLVTRFLPLSPSD